MQIKSREDIKDFVVMLEAEFPVNQWKFNEIHLWPLIRLELFFHIRKEIWHEKKQPNAAFSSNNTKKFSYSHRFLTYLSLLRKSASWLFFLASLKKKKYLFVSNNASRVRFNGVHFNRFFDTIINVNALKNKSVFLEIGKSEINEFANSDIVYSHNRILDNYKAYRKIRKKFVKEPVLETSLQGYDQFLNYLDGEQVSSGFSKKYSRAKLIELLTNEYSLRIDLFNKIFRKVSPEKVIILCYYSDLALIASANRLNIETIDLQHGAQTQEHLAYGSWSKIPETGYDFLPRTFWNWDDSSKRVIESWAGSTKLYRSFAGGNVWVDYWMSEKDDYEYKYKDYILYTLQPDSLRLDQLFPVELINIIKSKSYTWFIRLHPRQHKIKHEIELYLDQNSILDLVIIEQATYDPLPVLLKHCLIHMTNSSASTIEASLFGKKTILLDEVGRLYYSDLINESMAYYIPADADFEKKLNQVIAGLKEQTTRSSNAPTFYKEFFEGK
jgi:hypothetical protein